MDLIDEDALKPFFETANPGSVIVIDSKCQIVELCRSARRGRGPTHEINWTDPRSPDGYNPFALASIPGTALEREKQAERFASQFVKLERASDKGGSGQHFNETAWRNIAAFALYEIYEALRTSKDGHPAAVVQRFVEMATKEEDNESDDDQGGAFAALENMQAHARQHGFPARIVEDIGLLKMTHYEERQSHISTMVTKLQLLRSLSLRESMGKSTFRLEDFRKRPTSLFIGVPQSDADTYGKITALFLEALFSYLLDHPQQGSDLPILLVMDEFRDIPPIPNFVNLMTKGAGAGIDVNIMIQDLVQLRNIYKDQAKEIRNNCEYIFVYQSPDAETQKELSGLVGMETVKNKSRTAGRDILTSVTTSEQGRFLIRPEQWGIIPFGKHVLLVRGHYVRPILADCVFWDEHKAIRALVPPEARHAT